MRIASRTPKYPRLEKLAIALLATTALTPIVGKIFSDVSKEYKSAARYEISHFSRFNDGYDEDILHQLRELKKKDPKAFEARSWCVTPRTDMLPGDKDPHTLGLRFNNTLLGNMQTVIPAGPECASHLMSADNAYFSMNAHNGTLIKTAQQAVEASKFPEVKAFKGNEAPFLPKIKDVASRKLTKDQG